MTNAEPVLRIIPDRARPERTDILFGEIHLVLIHLGRSVIFEVAGSQSHMNILVAKHRITAHETIRGRGIEERQGSPAFAFDTARVTKMTQQPGFVATWRDAFLHALQPIVSPGALEAQAVRYVLPLPNEAQLRHDERTGAIEYRPLEFITPIRDAWPFAIGSAFLAHGARGGLAGAIFVGQRRGRAEPAFIRAADIMRLVQWLLNVLTGPHDAPAVWMAE